MRPAHGPASANARPLRRRTSTSRWPRRSSGWLPDGSGRAALIVRSTTTTGRSRGPMCCGSARIRRHRKTRCLSRQKAVSGGTGIGGRKINDDIADRQLYDAVRRRRDPRYDCRGHGPDRLHVYARADICALYLLTYGVRVANGDTDVSRFVTRLVRMVSSCGFAPTRRYTINRITSILLPGAAYRAQ